MLICSEGGRKFGCIALTTTEYYCKYGGNVLFSIFRSRTQPECGEYCENTPLALWVKRVA